MLRHQYSNVENWFSVNVFSLNGVFHNAFSLHYILYTNYIFIYFPVPSQFIYTVFVQNVCPFPQFDAVANTVNLPLGCAVGLVTKLSA